MLAVAFTLALFVVWAAIGLALLVALRVDVRVLRTTLTAPALGSAVMVVSLFVVSNAGIAMHDGAPPVLATLIAGSAAVLIRRRPALPITAAPVVGASLLTFALVARPMFEFGLDWLANANGDMAYYVLSATHLVGHGLQSSVDVQALAQNRNFASSSQDLTLSGLRAGTQVALAGLASVTSRPPVVLYMPLSIAVALSGACATGSLALQATRRWWAAVVATGLFVVSPLAAYGVLQQLLPQNWGLALAIALFAWLMLPEPHTQRAPAGELFAICVLAAALFIVAYEVAVALAAAYALYVGYLIVRSRVSLSALAVLWGAGALAIVVSVNTFLPRAVGYISRYVFHFGVSSGFEGPTQFGYAVVPTALAGATGLRSLFEDPQRPNVSTAVIAAGVLAIVIVLTAIATAFGGSAAAITLVAGGATGIFLARNGNEFGLFKLYMYMQPFVAATVAVALAKLGRRLLAAAAILVATVVAFQVQTLDTYVAKSVRPIDLPAASQPDLLPKFRRLLDTPHLPVVTVTDNFALVELEGAEAADNRQVFFVSRNLFDLPWKRRTFPLSAAPSTRRLTFAEDRTTSHVLSTGPCVIAFPSGTQVTLNRRWLAEGSPSLVALPCRPERHPLLAFVVSSRGQPATLPENRRAVSFWQLEKDASFPGHTFSGFGRYALFQVLRPNAKRSGSGIRVALDFTTTPTELSGGVHGLPPASVIGIRRDRFPLVGAGSARVVSPPIRPRTIDGREYIVLDMGRDGREPVVRRPGATGLWGRSVPLDPRFLTSYVRDVSIVSEAGGSARRPPMQLSSFPADLANPALEYSGFYEDGWTGKTSFARLAGGRAARLVVRAIVPVPDARQKLTVYLNGRRLASALSQRSEVKLSVAVGHSRRPRLVELRWTRETALGGADPRRVSARLTYLGLRP